MNRRSAIGCLSALLILCPAPALANGAMGLALATFGWNQWLWYVGATVLFEAFAFRRLLGLPARRCIGISVGANLATGIIGGGISGIAGYMFLGLFGSRLNPNPFWQTMILFIGFGLISALVESLFWSNAVAPETNDSK